MAIKLAGNPAPYTLKEDRDSDNPTVFHIKDLTAAQRGQLDEVFAALPQLPEKNETDTAAMGGILRAMNTAWLQACKIGIDSVTGVLNAEGDPVDLPAEAVIDQIRDPAHIRELGQAVLDSNRIRGKERGNS